MNTHRCIPPRHQIIDLFTAFRLGLVNLTKTLHDLFPPFSRIRGPPSFIIHKPPHCILHIFHIPRNRLIIKFRQVEDEQDIMCRSLCGINPRGCALKR
jgi:hypothetical protein